MILQALYEYYQRKATDPESRIAPEGFEWKAIPFLIVIDEKGRFVTIQDTREGEGKKKEAKRFLVPKDVGRSGSAVRANLLWDNAEYALGANPRGRDDIAARHDAFLNRILALPAHEELDALKAFLAKGALASIEVACVEDALWRELLGANGNVSFRMSGSSHSCIIDSVSDLFGDATTPSAPPGRCLITGEHRPISRTHAKIKGVRDAQSAGATLVSFNEPAYSSFGKDQNHNAPVSESAAFAYTTALNHLLAKDSAHKLLVGGTTTAFWSER